MKKSKKIALFYVLGIFFTFGICALFHLNSFLFKTYFIYAHWSTIMKTSIVCGMPFGLSTWIYMYLSYPTSSLDLRFMLQLFKPYVICYLMGIVLALFILAATQIYIIYFDTDYYPATYYSIFGFSLVLALPLSFITFTLKKTTP